MTTRITYRCFQCNQC